MAILHAEPLGWFCSGVRLRRGDQELTELEITTFKSKGSFVLDDDEFVIEPKGFLQTSAVLKKGNAILARAEKPSAFRRRFEISSAGHRLTMESRSWAGREYVLLLGNQEVGWIRRKGMTGRSLQLEFPDEVPVFLQILLAYLVVVQAKKEAAAAAGG